MDQQNPSTRSLSADRSPAMMAVDNLLRRALRVDDPRDPEKVAKALLSRYSDEAEQIRREQQGLPFSVAQAGLAFAPPVNGTATRPEIGAAMAALDDALRELTTSPALSEIVPELRGWSITIRRAASDGLGSARFAIDPTERDRAFSARRTLSEYGLLARYAGAVSDCARDVYFRLARAADSIANLVLIVLGDSLADAGIARSGAILQAPAATLQMRRDNVVVALRNLLGANQGDAQESWPRGPVAVFQLYEAFEAAGAPELRALLDETYLARQLDDLVDLATGSTPDGLRALGSVSATAVASLQRFIAVGTRLVTPASPPVISFFAELNLFLQGFVNGGAGYRLPYLARSPLLVSTFAGAAQTDVGTQTLLRVALARSAFADAIDCLSCDSGAVNEGWTIIVAAKLLFCIDRAIDLYTIGRDGGPAEKRAAAFGAILSSGGVILGNGGASSASTTANVGVASPTTPARRLGALAASIATDINWSDSVQGTASASDAAQLAEVVNLQLAEELRWSRLVQSIAPLCRQDLLFDPQRFKKLNQTQDAADPICFLMHGAAVSLRKKLTEVNGEWGKSFVIVVPRDELSAQVVPPTATDTQGAVLAGFLSA